MQRVLVIAITIHTKKMKSSTNWGREALSTDVGIPFLATWEIEEERVNTTLITVVQRHLGMC